MSDINTFEMEGVDSFVERSYFDYSMYVIMDRSIPFVGDGLKPVQRRIIYAMADMGLTPDAKFKKAARTVGDVLGKYHPHGDSACYEAMVWMSQDFNYRYPMIHGQGNWGSQDDPKSYAAMRYTEAKLNPNALWLLDEVRKGACVFVQNYDGTEKEPKSLPSKVPNILLNGCTGIAVGIATDFPPHNLYEVAKAVQHLAFNPDCSIADLMKHMPAPDHPTGATIASSEAELRAVYETGRGSYRARAVWEVNEDAIVIQRLPVGVSGSVLIESIANLMREKKLPSVEDIRDESDQKEPVRIVLQLRKKRGETFNTVAHEVMDFLFASTDLEKSYKVNANLINLDYAPEQMNLKRMLSQWIQYRKDVITRRVEYRLDKIFKRIHIIDGLLTAYLNLDRVIQIVREEDSPKDVLIAEFALTETQADAILDMKLRNLARLEEMTLNTEKSKLESERDELNAIIATDESLTNQVVIELMEVAEPTRNTRKSAINPVDKASISNITTQVSSDPITIILSKHDWIRAGRGHDMDVSKLGFVSNDSLKRAFNAKTDNSLYIIDDKGRLFNTNCSDLPSARSNGEPISSRLTIEAGRHIQSIGLIDQNADYLVVSSIGFGFVCSGSALLTSQKKGKQFMSVDDGHVLSIVQIDQSKTHVAVVTSDGRALSFPVEDLPKRDKGKGNKLINLSAGAEVVACNIFAQSQELSAEFCNQLEGVNIQDIAGKRAARGKRL